jgi:hypothetical protein
MAQAQSGAFHVEEVSIANLARAASLKSVIAKTGRMSGISSSI